MATPSLPAPSGPNKKRAPFLVAVSSFPFTSLSQFTVPVLLGWKGKQCKARALIDSGVAGNFLDANLARQLNIPFRRLAYPITVME